jgi:hypothetical protein
MPQPRFARCNRISASGHRTPAIHFPASRDSVTVDRRSFYGLTRKPKTFGIRR